MNSFSENSFANVIRLPFRWERLQPNAYGDLDYNYLRLIDGLTKKITDAGAIVLFDLQNCKTH